MHKNFKETEGQFSEVFMEQEIKLSDFSYQLPQELIAQDPLLKRSDSRLMVLDREKIP